MLATTALQGDGVEELVSAIEAHFAHLSEAGELASRRRRRLYDRTREVVDRATRQWVWQETAVEQVIRDRMDDVAAGRMSPYEVAAEVLDGLKQGARA